MTRSVLIASQYNLSIGDHMGEWRMKESQRLADLVQARFKRLQNPSNCDESKMLLCDLSKDCGFACEMHHLIYCFIVAFYSNRTLMVDSSAWRYNTKGLQQYFLPYSDSCTTLYEPSTDWNCIFI